MRMYGSDPKCPKCGDMDACEWWVFQGNKEEGCTVKQSHVHKECHKCEHEWVEILREEDLKESWF